MDDDKGLELSLGLPCGGSSANSKERSGNSADRTDTDERTSKIVNDFKNFLSAGIPQAFQRIDPLKPQETFFNNLSQTSSGGNASGSGPVPGDKRKSVFDEASNHKKQESESHGSDLQEKSKQSHISITTTDEGSTADNEDVAESEAEGSTSRMVSHGEDGSRTPAGSGNSSQVSKEFHGKVNSAGPRLPVQPLNTLNIPYSITIKESPPVSTPSTSSYPLSSMMQTIASTNAERSGPCTASPRTLPVSYKYSPGQLPGLDKDRPWGMVARSQALHSPYAGRPILTSVPAQLSNPISTDIRADVHPLDQPKGQTKQLVTEEGSSSHSEDDPKTRSSSFPSEYPSIKPGIAAEVKFGGSGSFPNLPWVSTTGPGPNGKTISGVTYKFNATQVKIVCACHGIHMSPDEFVRHASEDQPSPVTGPGIATIPSSNPAASARS